ncbi:MAG: hypothetical protein PF517_14870 [Salinivirgaceae bacterium]|jgi:hypothetical protein|nr:hypothetical protein [Salinivirgaceae bacterium]
MKKAIVLLVAVTLGLTTAVSAKKLPAAAASLPADFKQEITKHIDYPNFAKENFVEGEVWMKVTLDENSTVKIVDLSSTNPELGEHVKKELSDLTLENTSMKVGSIYFMKVKFDLVNM